MFVSALSSWFSVWILQRKTRTSPPPSCPRAGPAPTWSQASRRGWHGLSGASWRAGTQPGRRRAGRGTPPARSGWRRSRSSCVRTWGGARCSATSTRATGRRTSRPGGHWSRRQGGTDNVLSLENVNLTLFHFRPKYGTLSSSILSQLSFTGLTSGSGCVLTSWVCAAPRTTSAPTAGPVTWSRATGRFATGTGSVRGAAPGRGMASVSARRSTAGRCATSVARVTTRASKMSPSCSARHVTSRAQATAQVGNTHKVSEEDSIKMFRGWTQGLYGLCKGLCDEHRTWMYGEFNSFSRD